ncbi:hypothetical protein OF829_09715 [Sphingomonas sp. LB-2]|uniref:hypothetical protein n=1 Tax=Sphingomonas caeni TaxID=2984949 RepID=UPI00223075D1|nr:hypothetical protein [Sphingomonas caeni]MCW3847519.1 hypothetical protein [Sphingomonas caeni]
MKSYLLYPTTALLAAFPFAAQSQITTSGTCALVIQGSSVQNVTITNCGSNSAQLDKIVEMINAIVRNGNLTADQTNSLLDTINHVVIPAILRTDSNTADINEKVSKILDILTLASRNPENASASLGSLVNWEIRSPLTPIVSKAPINVQLIRATRPSKNYDVIRFVIRLSVTDKVNIGVITTDAMDNYIKYWHAWNDFGTNCQFRGNDAGLTISHSYDRFLLASQADDESFSEELFPKTIVLSATCSALIGRSFNLAMRYYYRPARIMRTAPDSWQFIDFRFTDLAYEE